MHSDSTTINAPRKNGMCSVASPLLRLENRQDPSINLHLLHINRTSTAFKHWAVLWDQLLKVYLKFLKFGTNFFKSNLFVWKSRRCCKRWRKRSLQDYEKLLLHLRVSFCRVIIEQGFYITCVADELHALRKLQHTWAFRLKFLMWKHHWTTPERNQSPGALWVPPAQSCPHCARVCRSRNPAHPTTAFYNLSSTVPEEQHPQTSRFLQPLWELLVKSWPVTAAAQSCLFLCVWKVNYIN